ASHGSLDDVRAGGQPSGAQEEFAGTRESDTRAIVSVAPSGERDQRRHAYSDALPWPVRARRSPVSSARTLRGFEVLASLRGSALGGVIACLSPHERARINEQHAEQDAEIPRERDPADLLLQNRRVLLSERVMTLIASGRHDVAATLRADDRRLRDFRRTKVARLYQLGVHRILPSLTS